jgi:ATP-dependent protease ClpP protease subunit
MKTIHSNLFNAKNVTNGVLDYYLFAPIGVDPNTGDGISGQRVADDFDFIQSVMKNDVKQINVRINSGGGSIIDGLSIISAIRNSTIPVDTYIDGIGASIAGVIFVNGKKRFMNDFGRLMIHDPSFETNNELTDGEKETLSQFKDVIKTILSNNSHYEKDQIDSIMSAETWFTAEQSLTAGLIDSIVKTERNVGLFVNDSKTIYSFANELFKRNIKNENQITMKKIHAKFTELKLFKNNEQETDTDKIETAVIETVESLKAKITELESANAEKDAKIAELSATATSATDTIAEQAVDGAVNDGKIDVTKKAEMLVIAKNDLKVFNTMIGAIAKKAVKVTNVIKDATGKEIDGTDGLINGKTLREVEKTADGSKLIAKIKNENPELFAKIYFKQYGVQPTV